MAEAWTTAGIRQAFVTVLTAAYQTAGWNISGYWLAKPEPPQLDLVFGPVAYDTAMQGGDDAIELKVRATVQWGDSVSGQQQLDALIDGGTSPGGIRNILQEADWADPVEKVRVVDVTEPQLYPSGGGDLIGVEFTTRVYP